MAAPTNAGERKMVAHVAEEENLPKETDEETRDRQQRNLNEIRITHRMYSRRMQNDPGAAKQVETLENQFAEGLRTGDFPAGAVLDPSRSSQGDVRKAEPENKARFNAANTGDANTSKPSASIQIENITTSGAASPLEAGANALKGFVEQSRDVISDLIRQTTNSTEEATAAHAEAAKSIIAAGASKAGVAIAEGEIEAANALTKQRILKIANLDTRETNNAFAQALAERLQLRTRREAVGAEIDERMAVGLLDNPLQYIVNATILPGRIAEYNALARREGDNIKMFDTLQAEVKAQEGLDLGATADVYTRRAALISNMELSNAQAKAQEIYAGSAALRAQKVLQIANLSNTRINQEELLSKWSVVLADKREANALKEQDRIDREDLNRKLKTIGALIGNNLATVDWLKGQSKDVQEAWKMRAATGTLGDSVAEAVEFVRRFGDLNVMRLQGAGEMADMFKAMSNEINNRAETIQNTWAATHPELASKPPKTAEARYMAAEQLQKEWEGQRDVNMLSASQVNPFKINHKKQYLTYSGDKNNPVYQMVGEAYKAGQLVDDKILLKATEELVLARVLQPREAAAALSEYYNDAIRRNNSDRDIRNMGMEKQENYFVRPPETGVKKFSLTNPVESENYLTLMAVRRPDPMGLFLGDAPGTVGGGMMPTDKTEKERLDVLTKKKKDEKKEREDGTRIKNPVQIGGARS